MKQTPDILDYLNHKNCKNSCKCYECEYNTMNYIYDEVNFDSDIKPDLLECSGKCYNCSYYCIYCDESYKNELEDKLYAND